MFRGYVRKQKADSSLQIIKMMLEQNLKPTVDMFNDIISLSAKTGNHSLAWRCFLDMQKYVTSMNLLTINEGCSCSQMSTLGMV
jgi:pentatricopeptide repeat protein